VTDDSAALVKRIMRYEIMWERVGSLTDEIQKAWEACTPVLDINLTLPCKEPAGDHDSVVIEFSAYGIELSMDRKGLLCCIKYGIKSL
jgi:hypothetical protein